MKARMNTLAFIASIPFLVLFIANFSFSQGAETEKQNDEVRGYLMLGGSKLDIDALNDRLVSKTNVTFSDEFFSIGGGYLRQKNSNWLFGMEGHVLFVDEQDYEIQNVSHKASLTAAYGFLDVGYAIISSGGLNIYPLIGFGGGGTWLQIGKNNFDDILEDPERNASLAGGTFMFNFALGSDYLIKVKEYEKDEAGIVFGFRVGYTYSPWEGGWWTDMISIENGPKADLTGPYLRVMIGFGGKGEWWKEEKK